MVCYYQLSSRPSSRGKAHVRTVQAQADGRGRVVVTGLGAITALGDDPHSIFTRLCNGESGISQIHSFDCSSWPTRIAGEIKDLNPGSFVPKKMARRMDRCQTLTLVAGKRALIDAGLPLKAEPDSELDPSQAGVIVGSGLGGVTAFTSGCTGILTSYRKLNPFCIPFSITNMGAALLAMETGMMGPCYSASADSSTGNTCLLHAYNHIRSGAADVVLAGAADSPIMQTTMAGFVAGRVLSRQNASPEAASRPWDKARDGIVVGEGGAVLVVESLEHAQKRGARVYAELLGGCSACDALSLTSPHPSGDVEMDCMQRALKQARVDPKHVGYVNAHAASTHVGDAAEFRAVSRVLAGSKGRMNSTKSMLGHLIGAASAVEAMVTVLSLHHQTLHPNVNLKEPEDEFDADVLLGCCAEDAHFDVAISNAFGFGGQNSTVVFRRWP